MNEPQEALALPYKSHSPELHASLGKEQLPKNSETIYFSDCMLCRLGETVLSGTVPTVCFYTQALSRTQALRQL